MCDDVIDQVGLMVSCIFHCEFAGLLELMVGYAKLGLKMDPILLNWIHPVPDFTFVLEFARPGNNRVGDVGCMDLGVRGYNQFPVF